MGRPKGIPTPELMWELFESYVKKVKSNPFKVKDWVGKDAELVIREKEKPLTMVGFELYCHSQDYNGDLARYFANTDNAYTDFCTICSRIRDSIKEDQITGGMAGMYNPSITQRLNGLKEQTENDNKTKLDGNINITFDIT